MGTLVDLAYLAGLTAASPVLLPRFIARGKHRTDWSGRFGHAPRLETPSRPRLLLHAVSVGEVNAISLLVDRLLDSALQPEVVIATTTDTGYRRACSLFESRCEVVRYPLDVSWSVRRFLDAIQPDVAAMVELELWPNFSEECERRGIPLLVVNGRLSERSFRGYRRARAFIKPIFRRLECAAVQNEAYAGRFATLGAERGSIVITGTMKWDTARIEDDVDGASELAEELGIDRDLPLVVAGSTAPDEHQLIVDAVPEGVQLLCAPRRPEWFDEAAGVLGDCARRSRPGSRTSSGRYLLDTIGELRKAYALAQVVIIGRSFGSLHGSDMMEPAALGKPVIVGPATSDFAETVRLLDEGDGIVCTTRDGLAGELSALLGDRSRREAIADNARKVITEQQGATERTCELLVSILETVRGGHGA